MNSYSDEKYSGLQVYYSKNNELSRELANSIQKNVREKMQQENKRAIKAGENMYLTLLNKWNNTGKPVSSSPLVKAYIKKSAATGCGLFRCCAGKKPVYKG